MAASGPGGLNGNLLRSHWYLRIPVKWLIFAVVTFLMLFPDPRRFVRQIKHVSNLSAMIDPNAPELAQWDAELRKLLVEDAQREAKASAESGKTAAASQPAGATSQPARGDSRPNPIMAQRVIERFVFNHVLYAWDWDVWGCADYMPTVSEMFAIAASSPDKKIHEDCDGRAVMAASLMKRFGYDAEIVTDLRHVWVKTKAGEYMGPGRAKTVVSTAHGQQVDYSSALSNSVVALSYGVEVFPLLRELVIVAAAFILMLRRGGSAKLGLIGGLLLFQGLLFMRTGHIDPLHGAQAWPAWVGMGHVAAAFATLFAAGRRREKSALNG